MLALYRSGRQADALSAYHDARRTLVDELGIEPGPELQALYGSILRQERSLVRVAPPALEDHYDEVMRAFSAGRLVPVLGPGAGGVAGARARDACSPSASSSTPAGRGLAYVSQAVAARNGIGAAARRAAPRARPRRRAVAAARVARRAAAVAPAPAGCRSS